MERNDQAPWKDDKGLCEALQGYVRQGLQRREVLDFIGRDFPIYTWSLRSLDRRLRHFGIFYNMDKEMIDDAEIVEAVKKELAGPGSLLGYRAMHKKIRQEHQLDVSRDRVYACMKELDPEGLERRGAVGGKRKKARGHFTTKGPNFVHSLDGHDKLMGYQNSTFPLAIYGCVDTASRKLLWLKVWVTNSDPKVIGKWYLDYLYETKRIPAYLRVDKGTETVVMATMHTFLRRHHDVSPHDTVIYGPSTSNQIERWWKELHKRMEKFYKYHLAWLKDNGHYDPHNEMDRNLLAFVMIPLIQKELDTFRVSVWNTHRIRAQKDALLPNGVPNHIYNFPEKYDLEECGFEITDKQLEEVAAESGVLDVPDDFIDPDIRKKCEMIIPDIETMTPQEFKNAYMYLKDHYHQ